MVLGFQAALLISLLMLNVACEKANIEIVPIGDKQIGVGQTLVFDIFVTGAKGESVSFTFESPTVPASDAQLIPYSAERATFRWTTSRSGVHEFTFRASAGGSSDTETIDIEVTGSSSAPVFLQPGAGGTYDLSRDPCVNVHIEVKDDDSGPDNIIISEKDPKIEGGELTHAGKTADWRWCPNTQQIEASDRYTLMLQAKDEDVSHSPVPHDFVVVLRGVSRDDCPGAAPVIQSSSPPPPDLVASNMDYEVVTTITDDQGIKEMPILYYTFDQPANPDKPDVTTFEQVLFESMGGDNFHAFIPNQGLDEDTTMTVYCVISATDNDDADGVLCDHRVDSALMQFTITGGSEAPVAYCERCSADDQCASGGCVVADTPFCGGACDACADLGGECLEVTVVGGTVMNLCVPPGLDCSGSSECTDDDYEDNDERTAARAVTPEVYSGLMICPNDDDYYSISVTESSTIDVGINGWNEEETDIDIQLVRDSDGSILDTSAGTGPEEWVTACVEDPGDYVVRVYGMFDDSGPYLMSINVYADSCCVNDGYEYNDVYTSPTIISDPSSPINGTICPSDNDWFRVHADSGQKLNGDMTMTGGDIDLSLYDTDGMRLLDSSMAPETNPEHVEYDIAVSGNYYFRVNGWEDATGDYVLQISFGTSSDCTDTNECSAGTICDGGACIDDSCTPPAGCPAGHFCPTPGGSETISDCVDNCFSSSECRDGYACKVFPEGRGCAGTGYGDPGDSCFSFRDCKGEMTCLGWPMGYCARMECLENSDCPSGSYCVEATGFLSGICAKDCIAGDDRCRLSEGYQCDCVRDLENFIEFVCLAPGVESTPCF